MVTVELVEQERLAHGSVAGAEELVEAAQAVFATLLLARTSAAETVVPVVPPI
jgi:hypothetical protein